MRTVLKWVGLVVGALAVIVVVAGFVASRVGASKIAAVYDVPVEPIPIVTDSAAIARGAHLAGIYGCLDCHGADLSGQVMSEEGPFRITAPNLTPAGVGGQHTPESWDRAIRHGVGADGRALFVMPSGAYHGVSDEEAAALIAYLQTVEPVANDLPPMEYRLMGRVLAAGPLNLEGGVHPEPTTATSPAPGATLEYGQYVAEMMCAYCHGPDLAGAAEPEQPGAPPPPDLAGAGQWTPEQFHTALTTGVTPSGHQINPDFMPWTSTARMTHDEREGVRMYLATLADRRGADV
jgi:mono/diheme cytochrome c family protein